MDKIFAITRAKACFVVVVIVVVLLFVLLIFLLTCSKLKLLDMRGATWNKKPSAEPLVSLIAFFPDSPNVDMRSNEELEGGNWALDESW